MVVTGEWLNEQFLIERKRSRSRPSTRGLQVVAMMAEYDASVVVRLPSDCRAFSDHLVTLYAAKSLYHTYKLPSLKKVIERGRRTKVDLPFEVDPLGPSRS